MANVGSTKIVGWKVSSLSRKNGLFFPGRCIIWAVQKDICALSRKNGTIFPGDGKHCVVDGAGAGKYANKLIKAYYASYTEGLAPHALCLPSINIALFVEGNGNQPGFYVEP